MVWFTFKEVKAPQGGTGERESTFFILFSELPGGGTKKKKEQKGSEKNAG